ncbi:MAG: penicillin-binding protein 2 [Coriobacteriales bacterium]|jgi:cell division protein FtsI (penicillin-binding protein 3)|nr:penicillin-binding protein 2 [Coriobacteriales bacterium]
MVEKHTRTSSGSSRRRSRRGAHAAAAGGAKATINKGSRLMGQGLGTLIGSWANRDAAVVAFFMFLTVALVVRLSMVMIFEAPSLRANAQEQRTVSYDLIARRGTIYDRSGNILALSVDASSVYVDPSKVANPEATATALRAVLGGTQQFYLDRINGSASPTFNYIYRKIEPGLVEELKAADEKYREDYIASLPVGDDIPADIVTPLTGINYLNDPKRVYPYGAVGAQVIGAVDSDGIGISGIEKAYDAILRGVNGSVRTERGKDGRPIPGGFHQEQPASDGQNIILTVDIDLQARVESSLADYGSRYECDNANALLLDGASGEIHAAASLPLYDREKVTSEDVQKGATTCKAITFGYEPGSVLKSVTAAAALEHNVLNTEDRIGVPAALKLDEYEITDSFEHGAMEMSFREILVHSSNIGISLIEDKIGDEAFHAMLSGAGFGQPTHVDYPGEAIGLMSELEDWNVVSRATMAFGQGIQVSSLQVASFYGAIANHGVQIQPHLLMARPNQDRQPEYSARRVMSQDSAERLESMLRSVVEIHAPAADIPGYQVVGKTGTAEKASSEGGYLQDNHIVSFVGYLANASSQMVCLTSFDNPLQQLTAPPTQPLFKDIMSYLTNHSMVTAVDAIDEAKAALAAAARVGELDAPAAGAGADADGVAGSAAGTPVENSGTAAGSDSGAAAGSGDLAASGDESSRLTLSTPRGYALNDSAAQPVLSGEREGWLLDTSG